MINKPVIAIGMDASPPLILEKWMSAGYLPNLNRLREQGIYSRLHNQVDYGGISTPVSMTEKLWVMGWTGCLPQKTGYWDTIQYNPDNYKITHNHTESGYDYQQYPPFYALGDNYKVAVFDPPVSALSEQVNGLQIFGWGGHFPFTPSHSQPPELLPQIIDKYGKNPVLFKDHGYWWHKSYAEWLEKSLLDSITTRTAICRDLLQKEAWDLFIVTFGETHSAGHDLWHLSQPDHPLYPYCNQGSDRDPMLATFKAVDRAIGEITAEVGDDANIICFSVHGMGINITDLFSMVFLPELLYRYNFPGKVALGWGKSGTKPPAVVSKPIRNSWAGEMWSRKYEANPIKRWLRPWTPGKFLRSQQPNDLISPYELDEQSAPVTWIPAMWYKPLWSQMKAFALPAFSDGAIRINLQGREAKGIVPTAEYDAVCQELIELVYDLRDARTGQQIVKDVIRTRKSPSDNSNKFPDPDLVVLWQEKPTDVVDSKFGRIGVVPYSRPGGHQEEGFIVAKGSSIQSGSHFMKQPQAIDLAPTILRLMGAEIPNYIDGKSLI